VAERAELLLQQSAKLGLYTRWVKQRLCNIVTFVIFCMSIAASVAECAELLLRYLIRLDITRAASFLSLQRNYYTRYVHVQCMFIQIVRLNNLGYIPLRYSFIFL